MWRLLVGGVWMAAMATSAFANGRPPQTSTITFRPGSESTIYAGMSFGLLVSSDSGGSWKWICEDALPYGGMYDPDYAVLGSGALFATTFDGLKVNRDGCSFDPGPLGAAFISTIARGPDNALYIAAADAADGKIHRSTDDGVTFPTSSTPGMLGDWWQSLEVAPSDPTRLYLSGFRFVVSPTGGNMKQLLLMTSADAGASWSPLPITDFTRAANSNLDILSVSATDPNTVYARITLEDNAVSSALYKSTNAGASWTRILGKPAELAFVARANGHLVAGTRAMGTFLSTDGGATWNPLAGAPQIGCLVENAAGEVWACTQNYGAPGIPSDGFGIMKSTDLATWTGVLKYESIAAPVTCPTSTLQYMKCDRNPQLGAGWCGLCAQLGCDPKRDCTTSGVDGPPEDAMPPDAGKPMKTGGGGGCGTSDSSAPGVLLLAITFALLLLRPRR